MYGWLKARWSRPVLQAGLIALAVTTMVVILWERQFSAAMGGLRFLDTYAWLAPSERYALIEAFGSGGRAEQRWFWVFGSFHSLVEYSTAALAAVGFARVLPLAPRLVRSLVGLAATGLVVELLENGVLLATLASHPQQYAHLAWASTGVTLTKLVVKVSMWSALATLLAWWMASAVRRRWREPGS